MTRHTLKRLIAIYLRISYDRHSDAAAVARQKEDALALLAREGIDPDTVEIFLDNDISGDGIEVRSEFDRMMDAAEQGSLAVIICYKADRLARNGRDALRITEAGKRYGMIIRETSGAVYDLATANGRMPFKIVMDFAEWESDIKRERQLRKNVATRAAGLVAGGRRPFGYDFEVREDHQRYMIINEREASALRWAYQAMIDGESVSHIARHWNDLGLRTPQGKRAGRGSQDGTGGEWTPSIVSRCLKKPLYAGRLVYKELIDKRTKTYETHDLGVGDWVAIIDEATFHNVIMIMSDPDRRQLHGGRKLLTGIARCGVCGGKVNGSGSPRDGGAYACASRQHFCRQGLPIDALVIGKVLDRLSMPDARDHVMARQGDDTTDLYARKRNLEIDLENQAEMLRLNPRMKAAVNRAVVAISADLDDIEAAISRATTAKAIGPTLALIDASDINVAWKSLTIDVQRTVIDGLVDIEILPTGRGTRRFNPDTVVVTF